METIFDQKAQLSAYVLSLRDDISPEFRAYPDDEEPGIQLTLACNDNGTEYATQTGDNSYTGSAYSFPHWAVTGVYKDSDPDAVADELLDQLSDLVAEV